MAWSPVAIAPPVVKAVAVGVGKTRSVPGRAAVLGIVADTVTVGVGERVSVATMPELFLVVIHMVAVVIPDVAAAAAARTG